MNHPYYVYAGSIYSETTGGIVEEPAILVDVRTGTLHGTGEADVLLAKLDEAGGKAVRAGCPDLTADWVVLRLADPEHGMSREMQCYVLNRCIEYTASGFPSRLCREAAAGTAIEWLEAEMARVPITGRKA